MTSSNQAQGCADGFAAIVGEVVSLAMVAVLFWSALTTTIGPLRVLCWTLIVVTIAAKVLLAGLRMSGNHQRRGIR